VEPSRVRRWRHAVDPEHFSPAWYSAAALAVANLDGPRIKLIYVGALDQDSGAEQVVDAVQFARERNPRVHLILIGEGTLAPVLQARLGSAATFVPTLTGEQLAQTYASADLLVTAGRDARCGRTIVEAQASGLPVLAFNEGEPAELVESGRSGVLVQPTTIALAEAIRWLARRGTLRERLATGGLQAARDRTWEQAQAELSAALPQARGAGDAVFAHAA
jgi:glycosyltransferase involved in cell wall biosynthesis